MLSENGRGKLVADVVDVASAAATSIVIMEEVLKGGMYSTVLTGSPRHAPTVNAPVTQQQTI